MSRPVDYGPRRLRYGTADEGEGEDAGHSASGLSRASHIARSRRACLAEQASEGRSRYFTAKLHSGAPGAYEVNLSATSPLESAMPPFKIWLDRSGLLSYIDIPPTSTTLWICCDALRYGKLTVAAALHRLDTVYERWFFHE